VALDLFNLESLWVIVLEYQYMQYYCLYLQSNSESIMIEL